METILIRIEPPDIDIEDVEDFLATDDLFVDYFNNFLSLPTFPEPLCFNKESGGFEVVSDARKALAKQIKEAIRSQKRKPKIYRVVQKHSYINIPLIPIEVAREPDNVEINTSFTVTTLNKEQGIHWIKAERLPAFLESDLYLEFRLSKLMSQARIIGDHGEYVLMKIDFKPRVKKVRKKKEEEEVKIDPKEAMMHDMYVCMGSATTTETDSWYATAQMVQHTETTYSASMSRPTSGSTSTTTNHRPVVSVRPVSARPASAYSDHIYNRSDSGMGSSILGPSARATSYGSVFQGKNQATSAETEAEELMSRLFSGDSKSRSRTAENVCVVSKDHSRPARPFSATVYSYPKSEPVTDTASQLGVLEDMDRDDSGDSGKGDEGDETITDLNVSVDSDFSTKGSIIFRHIDELGAVIVGTVLKRALATLTQVDDKAIEANEDIRKIFPDLKYISLTPESLDKVVLQEAPPEVHEKEPLKVHVPSDLMKKRAVEESDVDSLLDSEEDYEEADDIFRTHKYRTYSLTTRKGIDQFKRFLKGTHGERNWNLWVDIDRMRLMNNEEELQLYLCQLRERFYLSGAPQELTTEQKISLRLTEASFWTRDKLLSVQNQIVEPLILYWAPRFLLKQLMQTNPDKNLAYLNQKLMKPLVNGAYPNPPTTSLLPLRPKSCHPRVRQELRVESQHHSLTVEQAYEVADTSPPVGLRRRYGEPTLQFIAKWQKEQRGGDKKLLTSKLTVEKTSTPRIRSPASVRSSSSPTPTPRPKSARPSSVKSTSSRISVESATGRVRVKSPSLRPKSAKPQLRSPATTLLDFGTSGDMGGKSSRRSSAASSIRSEGSEAGSEGSEFIGGIRMETLLQALFHEADAGGFFRRYIERSGKPAWVYNMNLWRDLQEYHNIFYQKSIDAYVLRKKAKTIYSQYIVTGARHHIGCDWEVTNHIYKRLDPPFEDLFDDAEEHAISILHDAWQRMIEVDQKTYSKVELIDIKRRLETKSKYVLNLQKRGLIKERVSTPDDTMEGYEDPVYDEALLQQIPDEFKDYTLDKLVHNRIELEHFRNFLADNYASMDIMCWMDIEAFRRITHTDEKKRDAKAKEIKTKYLNKKYFFGPNSPAGKEGQEKVVESVGGWGKLLEDRPPNPMVLDAQKYVQDRLEKKWLPLFLVTPDFAVRQKPKTSMDDVVDDVLVQKRKKSQAVYKLLESKWVSSSKEIMIFRKALLNPVTNLQFRRFVSIKGDKLENDVLFWLEVQRFKDLYHAHTDDSLVLQKINTIVNCFVDSQIPPNLQIDILPDMAEKVLERKYERSPYLFRESQLMVFKVLFAHWNDFCDFRSNLADEKIMPLIERRRKHAKAKERVKQQEMDDKQAREAERRVALGLPPLGEEEDVFQDPFKSQDVESGDGEGEHEDKDKICWTYSNYMHALEKEELLNNTDETAFSSLLTDTESVKESVSMEQDRSSTGSKQNVSKTDSEIQTDKKKSVRIQNGKQSDTSVKGASKKKSSKDDVSIVSSVTDLQLTSSLKSSKQNGTPSPKLNSQPEKTKSKEGKVVKVVKVVAP